MHRVKLFLSAAVAAVLVYVLAFGAYAPTCPDGKLCMGSAGDKLIALTFDDGPGYYTGRLLDALSKRGAKVTFFLFGQKVNDETAPLLIRMLEEGHSIGNHTYSHARLTTLSCGDIRLELEMTDKAIRKAAGITPELIRPPFGSYDDRVIAACNRPVILWSLDTRDWEIDDPKIVCANIVNNVKDGDIVLLHELKKSSLDGVISAIDILTEKGYTFVTVPELFEMRGIELIPGKHYHRAYKSSGDK